MLKATLRVSDQGEYRISRMTAKYWPDPLGVFLQRKRNRVKKCPEKRGGVQPLWTKVLIFSFFRSDSLCLIQWPLLPKNQPKTMVSWK